MHIPLPKMMRHWRERVRTALSPAAVRFGLGAWAFSPSARTLPDRCRFRCLATTAVGRPEGAYQNHPGESVWTAWRDLPVPQGPELSSSNGRHARGTAMSEAREQILKYAPAGFCNAVRWRGERQAGWKRDWRIRPQCDSGAPCPHFEQVDLFMQMARKRRRPWTGDPSGGCAGGGFGVPGLRRLAR